MMNKPLRFPMWCAVFVVLSGMAAAPAQALEIQLPPDGTSLKPSTMPGYQLAMRDCTACHSAQYMQTQPASSHAWWEAEVKKMKATYGAQIPDADMPALAEYLFSTYGSGKGADEANGNADAVAKPSKESGLKVQTNAGPDARRVVSRSR